ncbi:hypothetical protein LZ554_009525 [Drepanopeziza brunnea f. sp. 'monogermtubi']|nr:hypothetical protein LZ554_009525 [Drepanopeziza brunnea f. sp. 'monogermtubi']
MTSSIDDAIRELHDQQKRSDSRRSSLASSHGVHALTSKLSNASSIVEVKSAARSGGYSPAGFMMSPKGSFTAGTRARSASKSSRYGNRPEPDLEGRPLESFVNTSFSNFSFTGPPEHLKGTGAIAEQDEHSSTLTRPVVDKIGSSDMHAISSPKAIALDDRPTTSASMNSFDQAKIWEDFDGIHTEVTPEGDPHTPYYETAFTGAAHAPPLSRSPSGTPDPQHKRVSQHGSIHGSIGSGYGSVYSDDMVQRRVSVGNRLSTYSDDNAQRSISAGIMNSTTSNGRPQSYVDPATGQDMVYYPAPVPMMLNLPQKLSKNPSSTARNKMRSQVMSSISAAARPSGVWLPDLLENEEDREVRVDDEIQHQEYMAQHQRATIGGRRLTKDLMHMPPQLRASTFFDLLCPNQMVELKDNSAVATLDSILDASAHAPVSAFTDHAFAGPVGAEVYGRTQQRSSQGANQLLEAQRRRTSSFNILRGKRASSSDLPLQEGERKRASSMDGVVESAIRMPLDDEDDEDNVKDTTPLNQSDAGDRSHEASGELGDEESGEKDDDKDSDQGQLDDEVYHGAPTTLLAELQLRKQQQKLRTRPLAQAYPNGMHSTLLELDAVAQVEQNTRKTRRINLAWEDPNVQVPDGAGDSDDDVPLGVLFSKKSKMDLNRPMGLMERRDLEDNEPLSQRRNRLQGRPNMPRSSTMMHVAGPVLPNEEALPAARPVSGDFASEMMSQFGGDAVNPDKGKGKEVAPPSEEEETLGQRRKRLQAEREARAREVGMPGEVPQRPLMRPKRSMADLLSTHPSAGAAERVVNYQRPVGGLLGMHEKSSQHRSHSMMNLTTPNFSSPNPGAPAHQAQRGSLGGYKAGQFNDGRGGGIVSSQQQQQQQQLPYHMYGGNGMFPQSTLGGYGQFQQSGYGNQMMMPFANPYANPYAMPMNMGVGGYNPNAMPMGYNPNLGMGMQMPGMAPLNQGQQEMVERWRQSIMQ